MRITADPWACLPILHWALLHETALLTKYLSWTNPKTHHWIFLTFKWTQTKVSHWNSDGHLGNLDRNQGLESFSLFCWRKGFYSFLRISDRKWLNHSWLQTRVSSLRESQFSHEFPNEMFSCYFFKNLK